ncbi:MAG: class I SAM-dependent methyltransferase [Anaerolineae bacterium]|nr:class I SAM-dependent methyltransferase [Anaerolineae bacterium]
MNRLRFWWRYFRHNAPWDTGIAPPEIVALADRLAPGRALDLGCGTGASSIYLAQRGWQVTGIDFIPAAIQRAQQKARDAHLSIDFRVGDVSRLEALHLSGLFDLAVDVGCLHTITPIQQHAYAASLVQLLRPGAIYTVYAFAPRELNGRRVGLAPDDVTRLFAPAFTVQSIVTGKDTGGGAASAWYELQRVTND